MADRPIIFSAPMVRALLDGRKTQTRRVLKPQLGSNISEAFEVIPGKWRFLDHDGVRAHQIMRLHFAPGDRLWVREAHAILPRTAYRMSIGTGTIDQREHPADGYSAAVFREGFDRSGPPRWRPSIHMPRWASRLTLTVTDVRVQRLREISDDDAKAEGVVSAPFPGGIRWSVAGEHDDAWLDTAREAFRGLWYRIHGPDAWDANPWVCAVSFTVHRGNIDAPMTPTPQDRKDTPDAD